jgi:hypothetical protein
MPARDATASDSDSEMVTVTKKRITKNDVTPSDEEPPTKDAEDDEDEEDAEEEYEIEAILDAKKGAFPEVRVFETFAQLISVLTRLSGPIWFPSQVERL